MEYLSFLKITPEGKAPARILVVGGMVDRHRFDQVSFAGSKLTGLSFSDCVFLASGFGTSPIVGCSFDRCVFEDCGFLLSRWNECSFNDCTFKHGSLATANFDGATFTNCACDNVTYSQDTKFPRELLESGANPRVEDKFAEMRLPTHGHTIA